jgi:uncharacterized protein YndB with AHSA1/START domain
MMNDGETIVEREIFIAAAPATVFPFLIDPTLMAQWIGLSHSLEPRPGGLFRVEVSRGNVARGVYTEVTLHRRVAFTWGWESLDPGLAGLPPGASLVEIELEPKDGGTLLRLRHSRLPEALVPIHRDRWSVYLRRLADIAPQQARRNLTPPTN